MEKRVKLNNKIYPQKAVEAAIKDYSGVCMIDHDHDEKYHIITFRTEHDLPKIEEEFCNYVIGMIKET